MRILNFGSLNIDYVYQVDHMVQKGETLRARERKVHCGGKGLNQSIALARAGAEVCHAGVLGEDGGMLKEQLEQCGVDTGLLKWVEGPSSHTVIQVDEGGDNCILFFAGKNLEADDAYIESVLSEFGEGDFILLQNELARTDKIMREAKKRGMQIGLNPSPISGQLQEFPLEYVDIFLLNETEGHALTGQREPKKILAALHERYPRSVLVLTLGEKGSCCLEGERMFGQEAVKAKAVDTTGAGDTFTGFFLAEYLENRDAKAALALAARASAVSVTRTGAAGSIPSRREVLSGV